MLPNEFSTLASIDQVYRDKARVHRKTYDAALGIMQRSRALLAHREYVAKKLLGFGDYAFHGAWSLLIDAMPETFRFLEIGVYKGNIVSLVGMLAYARGKNAFVVGVSPFDGGADRYNGFENEDCSAAVDALEEWCQIPLARRARLIHGRSQDHDVREACRASGPYDIVFLDGSDDSRRFASDLACYGQLVAEGGYLVTYRASAGLDLPPHLWSGSADIARAIATVLDPDPRFRHVAAFGHMRVWTKRADDPGLAATLSAAEIPVPLRFAPAETRRFGGTPDRLPDLVIAFVANYHFTEIEHFIASLLNHGQNIHLTLFADNMDEIFHILAERLNIEVVDARPFMSPDCHIVNSRFRMYQDYLRATPGRWRNVLVSDVRDVVFQADPFAIPLPAPVVFAAEDLPNNAVISAYDWIVERYGHEIADAIATDPIICAGTTIGSADGMMNYIDAIWSEIASDSYDHRRTFDQISHNYIASYLKPDWGHIDLTDAIIATIGVTKPDRIAIADGRITVDGKAPPVVHQWDRKPNLVAFIRQSPEMHLRS